MKAGESTLDELWNAISDEASATLSSKAFAKSAHWTSQAAETEDMLQEEVPDAAHPLLERPVPMVSSTSEAPCNKDLARAQLEELERQMQQVEIEVLRLIPEAVASFVGSMLLKTRSASSRK
eukprot:TRINITY_DN63326_c0_g1_i1.p2 TRINITY_DN63326_c0_g1~~TRINITY_DN63326_c0_g1_i1.p2  ORF type:complete len:122 (+),score=35.91 TRINITY_DN63326_c0_g1_i1:374-739(+)